jgi:hypothetical protein
MNPAETRKRRCEDKKRPSRLGQRQQQATLANGGIFPHRAPKNEAYSGSKLEKINGVPSAFGR